MRRPTLALLALSALAGAQNRPFQARDRHEYDLIDVDWTVTVNVTGEWGIAGKVVNTVVATKNAPTLVFDCAKLTVDGVTVDGKKASFKADGATVSVDSKAKAGTKLKVAITYHGQPEAGMYYVPAARAFPAKTDIVYTQGEMEDNRYWLPTYDSPNDKATSRGTVVVPQGWNVLSNGTRVGGATVHKWAMDRPHATYLISFVAGPYTEIPDGKDPVPASIWTPTGLEGWGENAFGGTDEIIRFYGKLTGTRYPWPKYAQSAVADFMFGGMENISATTQTIYALFPDETKGTRDSTGLNAHELAHQWFGDLVTAPRWDDIWINEGWATFLPHFWTREKRGQEAYDLERYDTLEGAKASMSPSRTMVWSGWNVPMDMFDGNAYAGGAARMFALMNQYGEPAFWKATQEYLSEYGGKNVDTAGFFAFFGKSLARDLSGFERQWFRTAGVAPKATVRRETGRILIDVAAAPGFSLSMDVWNLKEDGTWEKRKVNARPGTTTVRTRTDGLALVDAEAYLPIDVVYEGLTKDDWVRLWKLAPNAAQRARLMGKVHEALTPAERNAWLAEEKSSLLRLRMMSWGTDPALLIGLSREPDERLAQAALGRMSAVKDDGRLLARLSEVWNDPKANPDLRYAALSSAYSLSKSTTLIEDAWNTPSWDESFRTWALNAWASTAPDRAREVALAALTDGSSEPVRLTAISVLGRVKDKPGERTVFNALAAMMTERSNSPLRAAIGALADYGDKAAIPLLERRKDHGLHFVRGDVARALAQLKR